MYNPQAADFIETHLPLFQKMYDHVRLVDPLQRKVLKTWGKKLRRTDSVCYEYWGKKPCENCISIRAFLQKKVFIKLEYSENYIMAVTAVPFEIAGKTVVVELLRDASDSLLISPEKNSTPQDFRELITHFNNMATRDGLTSIYNRRFIDERLPVDVTEAAINGWPISVIFMDIDNFKSVNDIYGHVAGDSVLKELANVIKTSIQENQDWGARYGGDEFFVCLNNTDAAEANRIAERIRSEIEKTKVQKDENEICVTVSLGLLTMQNSNLSAEEILSYADKKMFEAKKNGKNRLVSNF